MPRGDGTGPMGMGTMSGRGAGLCGGFVAQGAMRGVGVFGCRRGAGGMMRGEGFQARNRFESHTYAYANVPAGNEKEVLTNQVKFLEQQLQQVKQRLENISPNNA